MQLIESTDGKINGRLGNIFQVTLDGSNGTLAFFNFTKGESFTLLLKQDSTGGRTATFPSGVTWQAKQAPSLQTDAGATDVFQLTCHGDGTYADAAGAPNRLPARLKAVGLATMVVIGTGGGMAGIRANLSQGSGEGVGNLPNAYEVRSNSGNQLNTKVNGTGSVQVGSGVVAVGVLSDRPASTVGSAVLKVTPSPNVAAGTGTVVLNGSKGGAVCYADTDGAGYTKCDANNGTVTCKVATALECL